VAVERISQLRDHGVFRDFAWPTGLPDFGRYNLLYGWNGSGKTTLSRVFRALELRRPPATGEAVLRIGGADVRGAAFPQSTLHVRVFNRDFIHESVFPVDGGDVPPIFIVGKESVEKQKEADRFKTARTRKESELATAKSANDLAARALDDFLSDQAKALKNTLRTSGKGAYNEFDKRDYKGAAQKMATDGDAANHRLTDSHRDSLLAQHRATPKPAVTQVAYSLLHLQELADEVSALLRTTVVSAAIQSLKDDPILAEWTRHGLGLHRDRKSDKCLYCQQSLPEGRLAELEAHFNAEYERFLQTLEAQIQALESATKRAAGLRMPDRAALFDDLSAEYDTAEQILRRALDATQEFLCDLVRRLGEKKSQPFAPIALTASAPAIDGAAVDRLNDVIRRHNQACDDFERRASDARDRLALDLIAEGNTEYVRLRDAVQRTVVAIPPIETEIQRLSGAIERLEREIVEHQQPAEELNEDLRKYLGHGELQLAIKDTGYSITRNGSPADMLSEGEMTAIALLYFLKSLDDRGFDKGKGVVVLDDPVSSLDQNALFAAFGYIRVKTHAAAQLIVLTHSFLFFRLVREWFGNLRGQDRRTWQVLMLQCEHDGACRTARIRAIDPLLMDFESEYHYLFARVHKMANDPPAATLEAYYCAPSIARRVIETFVAFRVPDLGGHNRLWSQMQTIQYDETKKSRIYRYLQTHSHRDVVGEADEDLTLLGESRAVLNDVIGFMQAADADHVTRMIAKVTAPDARNGP